MTKPKMPRNTDRPKRKAAHGKTRGYCLPPEDGKIKKGEIRNPWGPKGKPRPDKPDPFEFAASQPTKITIGGEVVEVTAEAASHLVNMQKAIGGDTRAHRSVQEERRSRRRAGPMLTEMELKNEHDDNIKKKALSLQIVGLLENLAQLIKLGVVESEPGTGFVPSGWLRDTLGDLREERGLPRDPGPGGSWRVATDSSPG